MHAADFRFAHMFCSRVTCMDEWLPTNAPSSVGHRRVCMTISASVSATIATSTREDGITMDLLTVASQ